MRARVRVEMVEKAAEQWVGKLKSALKDPKILVLLVLFIQNSVSTLVRRYVLGIAKVEVSYAEALLVAEMIKGAVAVYYSQSETHEASGKTGVDYIFWLIRPANSWQMLALAALYGVMNVLNFVAARRLSSSTFTVLVQLKILATALCSVTMLGRSYSATRWRAVLLLVLSSILVASRSSLGTTCALCEDTAQYTLGVVAVLCEVAGSGFALGSRAPTRQHVVSPVSVCVSTSFSLPLCAVYLSLHTHTHSLSHVLVVKMKSKELKAKIYSHAHAQILPLSLLFSPLPLAPADKLSNQ